jgi:hypothetical protein
MNPFINMGDGIHDIRDNAIPWCEVDMMIAEDDKGKVDHVVKLDEIRAIDDGRIFVNHDGLASYTASEWATGQFCTKAHLPRQYSKFLNNDLRSKCINYGLVKLVVENGNQDVMLRCKERDGINTIRGLVSTRYKPYDNKTLVDYTREIFEASGHDHVVQECKVNGSRFMLRVGFPEIKQEVSPGDWCNLQVVIGNSEVGASSVWCSGGIFRLVCSNGLIIGTIDFEARIRHITTPIAIESELVGAITNSLELGYDQLTKFREAALLELVKPLDIIKELGKRNIVMTQDVTDTALNKLEGKTQFDVINAITATARELPLAKRIEVETFAGFLLGHPELMTGIDDNLVSVAAVTQAESIINDASWRDIL